MLQFIGDFLWGKFLVFGLVGIGLFLTIASRFVQFRYFLNMFGVLRQSFVSVVLMLFAFTSIMYSYYLGENCLDFFIPGNRAVFNTFRLLVLVMVLWGAMQDLSTIFAITDLIMGLVATVNLIALVLLFKVGMKPRVNG